MKRHFRKTALRYTAISLICCLFFTATAQNDLVVDEIIAKVDNYIVLKSDLERAYLDYLSRGEFNQGNAKCRILETLIVNKMMVAKAEIDSVIVEDDEVAGNLRQRMDYMVSQIGSEEEIEKFYGKSLEQIENELFDEVKEQLTIQKMQGEITANLKVTPSEVKRFFAAIPRDSLPYFSTEVTVGQIVKNPVPGRLQELKVEGQLLDIRGRILGGESFATLARAYSEDPGSAASGGELPFFRRGELAPEYEATAMTLEKGEISQPVKTKFGIHLIELIEKRGNTFKSRHIIISPKPSMEDMKRAETELDSIRDLILLDSITFRDAAKEFSDDQFTSSNGGYFADQDGATRVSVETLDPNIFFTIDTMKVGSITKPIRFTQPDGKVAYRILYYKDRIAPHQASLKNDYQKIAQAALNQKRSRILGQWFEKARDDVFIEIIQDYDYCNLIE